MGKVDLPQVYFVNEKIGQREGRLITDDDIDSGKSMGK